MARLRVLLTTLLFLSFAFPALAAPPKPKPAPATRPAASLSAAPTATPPTRATTATTTAASPPAAAASPSPAATPAPVTAPEKSSNTLLIVLGVAGVLVLGGIAAAVLFLTGGGSDRDDKFRTREWESRMTEPQEVAMLGGLEAISKAGESLYVSRDDGTVRLYGRPAIVSLYRLVNDYLAAGPVADTDPTGTLRRLLDGYAAAESQGVLHFTKEWYAPPVDGLDKDQFTSLCSDTLSQGASGDWWRGSGSDENLGEAHTVLSAEGRHNLFTVDLRRVLTAVTSARASGRREPLMELVRPVLTAMCRGQSPGGMWVRGDASQGEVAAVSGAIASSTPRA